MKKQTQSPLNPEDAAKKAAFVKTIAESSLSDIAATIRRHWRDPYFGAKPYLAAMANLQNVNDCYGADSGKSIVLYFLSNANTWRGEVARVVKAELKRRVK